MTAHFTALLRDHLSDNEYRELQALLIENPDRGPLIRGAGGVRKIRFGPGSRGKRGGVRVIYCWVSRRFLIYFLTMYAKCDQEDQSPREKAVLRSLAKELDDNG